MMFREWLLIAFMLSSFVKGQSEPGVPRVDDVSQAEEGVPYLVRGTVTGLEPGTHWWISRQVEAWVDEKWSEPSGGPLSRFSATSQALITFTSQPRGTHVFGFLLANGRLIWNPGLKRVRFSISRVGAENWVHGPWHEFVLQPAPATNRLLNDAIMEARMFPASGVRSRQEQMLLDYYGTTWNVNGGCPVFLLGGPNAPEMFLDDVQALATDPRMSPTWRAYAALRGLSVARAYAETSPDRRADMQRRAAVFLPLAELSGPRWQWMIDWEKLRLQALRGAVDRRDLERFRDHPERDPATTQWVEGQMFLLGKADGR